MSRGLTSAMKAAVLAGTVYPIMFGQFNFAGGTIYVSTWLGPVVWNSVTWQGLGNFVSVQPIKETSDVSANSVSFVLSGVPPSLVTEVFNNRSRGRPCTLWFGCYSAAGALLADPQVIFAGRMNQPAIADQGADCTISLSAESRLVDLQRPRERRYTDQDQKNYYPTDNFLKFVAGLQDRQILWGPGASNTASGTTPLGNQAGSSQSPNGANYGGYYGTGNNGGYHGNTSINAQ